MSIDHDTLRRETSIRYAKALSAVAGAEQRISELEDALIDADEYRRVAEEQLSQLKWREEIGRVFTAADEEPEDLVFLFDLSEGKIWRRHSDGWQALSSGRYAMTVMWPLDTGPFIGFSDGWELNRIVSQILQAEADSEQIDSILRTYSGYRLGQSVHQNTIAIVKDLESQLGETRAEKMRIEILLQKHQKEDLERLRKSYELGGEEEDGDGSLSGAMIKKLQETAGGLRVENGTTHGIVKIAEHQLLQDVEVPDDGGDPIYKAESLLLAATLLLKAADRLTEESAPCS